MRQALYLLCLLLLSSCAKEQLSKNLEEPDAIFYYQNKAYPVYVSDEDPDKLRKDENSDALQAISDSKSIVTFGLPNQAENHVYWFDSEMDGYDYYEKNIDALIGRRFKVEYRITELRTRLIDQFGELDFNNSELILEATEGIEAIYAELKLVGEFPRDLEAFIGIKGGQFSTDRNAIFEVFSDSWRNGSSMVVETAANTAIWTYGQYGCYTMAANPDLRNEFQPNGNNWNDVISSVDQNVPSGASAIAFSYHKDINYAQYGCAYTVLVIKPQFHFSNLLHDLSVTPNWRGLYCGHMNDQISSVRAKAVWSGCNLDFSDLYN